MRASPQLAASLSSFVSKRWAEMSRYNWNVGDAAWRTLGTGFDHKKYANDLPRQNVELKRHLSECWTKASVDERIRLANWIVSDWGGIHRNSEMTILGYINQADAERPATPFYGIASYSKILGIKAPEQYAVFDARVASSLNAIQLLLWKETVLASPHLLAFLIPPGRNDTVNRFATAAFPLGLQKIGFSPIAKDAIYGTYLSLLQAMVPVVGKSILEIEMILFAQADDLCEKALPLIKT